MTPLEPAAVACLERTRSAVLNVLVGVGLAIALSGFLLRQRDRWPAVRVAEPVRRGMLGALLAIVVTSYGVRRVLGSRTALREPASRCARFHRAHMLSALVATVAIPLGLAYGWVSRPVLNEVAPFWVAALALGFLALPRASELDDFDAPIPPANEA
ncbi:MAG: hypothetical protein P4L84_30650 [Isosphaeraceae bacterium]|nr:hypothetical protein [Isosphaeraceae bacterium]